MSAVGKRIKTLLLIGIVVLLAFQWPPGPGNTKATDIALVLAIIFAWPVFWKHKQIVRFPLILPQYLILLGGLFATLSSIDRTTSILAMVQDLYLYVCFLTLVNLIDNEADLYKMMKTWVVMASLEIMLMIGNFLGISRQPFTMIFGPVFSTLGQTNIASNFFMFSIFIPFAIHYPRRTWLRAGIVALLLMAIYRSNQKLALGFSLLGLLVLLLYRTSARRRTLLLYSSALAFVGALALGLLIPLWTPYVQPLLSKSVDGRLSIWTKGWKIYLYHPLGIGPNNFIETEVAGTDAKRKIVSDRGRIKGFTNLHNDYYSHLVERGPLGFVGLLLLALEIIACLRSSITLTQHDREQQFMVLALGIGLIGHLAQSFFEEAMHWRAFWVIAAIFFAYNKLLQVRRADAEMAASRRHGWVSRRLSA
jgi:hypothetical protein